MPSGLKVLRQLDGTLGSARKDLERLDRQLQTASASVARNRQLQARTVKELAAVRLDAIRRDEIVAEIDRTDRKVQQLLDEREQALEKLDERLAGAQAALDALEQRRETIHDDVDAAAETLANREAEVQRKLEDDPAFQEQLERTREADAIAVSAADKARIAHDDRLEKGKPFEGDELFMYLWRRHYGTSEYRANLIARMFDAWVARLCKYKDARANYWMLLEIPKRLQEHAEKVRDEAESEVDALQDLEAAAATAGGVDDARAALAELERQQDSLDADIEQAEKDLLDLRVEKSRFNSGDDDYLIECLKLFAETMERRDVSGLTRLAMSTLSVEDDAIVNELRELRLEEAELREELRDNEALQREHLKRVNELQDVRKKFKRNRYDDLRSNFDNGNILVSMMGEVLRGAIQGGALWDVLRRYQRYNDVGGAWPDFGSGGIVRPGRRSRKRKRRPSWHWPGPSRSSGGGGGFRLPKIPRSRPSRGRGGFRTGGGF